MADLIQPPSSAGQAKPAAPGKDLAIVGCMVVVLLAILGGIAIVLVRFALPLLKGETKPEAAAESAEVQPPAPPESPAAPPTATPPAVEQPRRERQARSSAPVPPPQKQAPAAQDVDLAANVQKAAELADISITGEDISHLKLEISNTRSAVVIHVPAGMIVGPVDASNMCPFVVHEAQTVEVPPQGTASVLLKAAGMDFRHFLTPVSGVRFKAAEKPASGLLARFLASGATRTSSWNMVQAGVWVIENDIGRTDLQGFQLTYADPAAPGGVRSAPVVSYAEIKTVEGVISSLGVNPDTRKLFREEREERQRLLAQVNFREPAPEYMEILGSKALSRYTGDSEVDNVLREYLTRHKRYGVRRSALENLIELGSREASDSLVQRSTYGDHYYRFLAAFELFRRGDERSYPLLAVHGEDPMFGDICAQPLSGAILARTGVARQERETLMDYWSRAVGWNAYPASPRLAEQVRRAVELYLPRVSTTDPRLVQLLQQITSDDDNAASQACSQLRAFPRNGPAFEALCRMAATHRSPDVRRTAISSLSAFEDFNPGRVCLHAAKNGEEREVYAAIELACASQFDGIAEFLKQVAQHSSADVRRYLAQNLGQADLPEAEGPLLLMARFDTDEYVRRAALRSLGSMKSPESLKLSVKLLTSGNREDKQSAFQCLQQWRDNAQALDILERYRNDPDIGTWISQHLSNYGRGQ